MLELPPILLFTSGLISDSMSPEELFGDGSLRDVTKVTQKGTLLEVNVHAVAEAVMRLADESILVHSERVADLSTA